MPAPQVLRRSKKPPPSSLPTPPCGLPPGRLASPLPVAALELGGKEEACEQFVLIPLLRCRSHSGPRPPFPPPFAPASWRAGDPDAQPEHPGWARTLPRPEAEDAPRFPSGWHILHPGLWFWAGGCGCSPLLPKLSPSLEAPAHGFCARFGKAPSETCRCFRRRNVWPESFLPVTNRRSGTFGWKLVSSCGLRNRGLSPRRDAACALAPGSEHPDVVKVVTPWPGGSWAAGRA